MRVKKPALVITFATTTAAIRTERLCQEQGLPGRIIPVPREITAGCGLAWKAEPQDQPLLEQHLTQAGIAWEQSCVLAL